MSRRRMAPATLLLVASMALPGSACMRLGFKAPPAGRDAQDLAPHDVGVVDGPGTDLNRLDSDLTVVPDGPPPPASWIKHFGGTGWDEIYAIAVDQGGSAFVVGFFEGSITIGGQTLTSAGVTDVFVAELDRYGTAKRAWRFGGTEGDYAWGIAVDSNRVYVTGSTHGQIDFGAGAQPGAGSTDAYVAAFDRSGGYLWATHLASSGADNGRGLAAHGNGVYAVGAFEGSVSVQGTGIQAKDMVDIYVAAFTPQGTLSWIKAYGGTGNDVAWDATTDDQNNLVLAGWLYGDASLGGPVLAQAGSWDAVAASYDTAGNHRWSYRSKGSGEELGYGVAASGADIYLTGLFTDAANLGGASFASSGGKDGYIAGLGATGAHQWSRAYGDSSEDIGNRVVPAGNGQVYATGLFSGTIDLGGTKITAGGAGDSFVARYGPGGQLEWSQQLGGTGEISAWDIALDSAGGVWVGGMFSGTMQAVGSTLTSAGGNDIFLVRIEPDQ